MMLLVFALRDSASDAFGVPQFNVARGAAIRAFSDGVNQAGENNPLFNHPEDFCLYEIGSYDDSSGALIAVAPVMISRGQDVSKAWERTASVQARVNGDRHASE